MRPDLQGVNGPMIEGFHDMVKQYFSPPPTIELQPQIASPTSIARVVMLSNLSADKVAAANYFSSAPMLALLGNGAAKSSENRTWWTACIYDIAIGATDICIGHIWQTLARETLTPFLPEIGVDRMILLIRRPDVDELPFW